MAEACNEFDVWVLKQPSDLMTSHNAGQSRHDDERHLQGLACACAQKLSGVSKACPPRGMIA
jgi:hypothetical protein